MSDSEIDDVMLESDAPPSEYLHMRRRSNTLPKDFLSNLRNRHKRDSPLSSENSFEDDDKTDGTTEHAHGNRHKVQAKVLNQKLKNVIKDREDKNGISKNGTSLLHHHNNNKLFSPRSPSILKNQINSKSPKHLPPIRKISVPEFSSKSSAFDHLAVPTNTNTTKANSTDNLIKNLMQNVNEDELKCATKQRSPLPRGSNLYESVLQEFGHEEEERDFLSPLPSPNMKRRPMMAGNGNKFNTSALSAAKLNLLNEKFSSQSLPSTPPGRHAARKVHWSQDTHFNKYK